MIQQHVFIIEQYFKNNEILMKHIFTSMALLIDKIAVFGVRRIMISEKQMHPQSVWCGFWAGGPYFFENEAGQAATVNAARYLDMITQFFLPNLDNIDVTNMWF